MKTYLNINSIQDKSIPASKLEESYVSQENGKGLSTNDFTDILKNKLLSLNNYDDSELNEKILKLEQNLNSILGEGSTEAIENFNEIIDFLSGIEDSESLDNIIAAIELQISNKQDKINDLQKIREGASKGETALQEIPEEYITEDELANKGYLTEHQDITPEILQNENEVAIKVGNNTSNYATINYSKFSNDLTGRIEATPEEFTFRPSAGDKSIRDESALIKRIKGNSLVWNQGVTAYGNVSINGLTFEKNGTTIHIYGTITTAFEYNQIRLSSSFRIKRDGRKYLFYIEAPDDANVGIAGYGSFAMPTIWSNNSGGNFNTYLMFSKGLGETIDYTFKNPMVFDLTQMFGAGNEPTTVEEFKALFPNDYYEYNSGELVSMTSNGLFANGFNQWDEEWERGYLKADGTTGGYVQNYIRAKNYTPVIGGAVYYANVPNGVSDAQLYAVDENYNLVKQLYPWTNTQFQIPNGAKYIRFYMNYGSEVYNNNININLSHTGVRNGEYEPYWDATKDLSIIQKYFHNGMRSAGSIYDEISFDETTQKWVAIQRVGSVDLGSLSWVLANSEKYPGVFMVNLPIKKGEKNCKSTINLVTTSFVFADSSTYADNTLYQNTLNTYLYAKFTSYTDVASFKTAMSGVMLYYELAEPIITTIEEVIDLSYKVGDFGTEKMLSDAFSAPFKADIIYQFNAVDRVRENSMNISKLSKKHNLLESEVNNHDGQINEFNTRLSKAETLTRKVEDGSVVSDNTVSEVTAGVANPVSSGGVAEALEEAGVETQEKLNELGAYTENPEWIQVTTDSEGNILEGIKRDGEKYVPKQHTKIASFGSLVLSGANATEIGAALKANGFTTKSPIDWSDDEFVQIPIPRTCAMVNIISESLPTTKTDNIPAILEYWDKDGNYFKKPIILNAQGSSSMAYELKNLSIDIDDGSEIKFGHWVVQDSFHFKAYYIDVYRGMANFCYNWCEELIKKMGCRSNRLARGQETTTLYSGTGVLDKDFDTGALCHPDGFPIEIYHNGEYHGLFAWNLKKHRKNYMMDKNDATSTILDGSLSEANFWNGTIDWTQFELRNPKDLVTMDGSEYDGENPQELIDATSSYYDTNNKAHQNSATIKAIVERLAGAVPAIIAETDTSAAKALFETYFDKEMMICYFIGSNVVDHYDGFAKNWIWTIYNGGKAAPNFYDMDSCFGRHFRGNFVVPDGAHINNLLAGGPITRLFLLYQDEIKRTYAELRENKIIDVDFIMSFVYDWMRRVGYEAYERNLEKYPDLPSYRSSNINDEYWKFKGRSSSGNTYDANGAYTIGDVVSYGQGEYYNFECIKNCTGIPPISQFYSRNPFGLGMYDTPERLRMWLVARIAHLDERFNYNV